MPPLANHVAEVWTVDLGGSDDQLKRAYALLSVDERERAAKYRFPVHRDRFILARAALRGILAGYLQIAPVEIAFDYSEYGKPSVRAPQTDIRFNTSHSAERALIACTHGVEIGVDIECVRRDLDVDGLAHRFFSNQENERLRALPPDIRHFAFFRCWTCKEAYVKAAGKGLSLGLNQFDVSAAISSPAIVLSTRNEVFALDDCSLIALGTEGVKGFAAATVVQAVGLQVSVLTPDAN
jgi:4'-phosphopantetheinyl transferase